MGLFSDLTGAGKGNPFLNRSKYVNDFKVEEVQDKKGRLRKIAVYIGTWFVPREEKKAKGVVFTCLALAVATAVLYFRSLLLTHFGSGKLLVMLPLLLGLFPLLYLLMGATELPYRGRPMRRDQYMHSFIRMSRSAVAVSIFAAVGLVALFVFRAVEGDWLFLKEDWRFLILVVLSAGCAVAIIFLLRGVDLMEKPNSAYDCKI